VIDYSTSGTNTVTGGITINNCIFGHGKWASGVITTRGIRTNAATGISSNNNYKTADNLSAGNDIPNVATYNGTVTQLWRDPYNGDFTIIDNSFAGKNNAGDPRWRP
jgi:hypothetical protein